MKRYSKISEVLGAIREVLGSDAHLYDVEAIADEAYAYRIDTDDRGNELLNTARMEQIVSDEQFWEIAFRHANG